MRPGFKRLWAVALVVVCAMAISGCITSKSYVDPTFAKTRYEDLTRPAQPLPLRVNVQFSRNGTPMPQHDNELRRYVESVLRGSGLVTPSDSGASGTISVSVDNITDMGAAAAKGFGTGLTFGLVGSTVQDGYVMNVALATNGGTVTKSGYKHLLITTLGNTKGPEGVTPTSIAAGSATIVEQMLLNALSDLQKDGLLANPGPSLAGPGETRSNGGATVQKATVSADSETKVEADHQRDVYTELLKLDDLKKKGIITDAEFETQKQKILSGE